MLKWAGENGCPPDESAYSCAVTRNNMEIIKWLGENNCPWDKSTYDNAVTYGHIEILPLLKDCLTNGDI